MEEEQCACHMVMRGVPGDIFGSWRRRGMRSLYRRIQVAVLLLAVVALVSACGGGGGDERPQTMVEPTPEPPPVIGPECVQTVLGCLEPEPYAAERQAIADVHVVENDFKTQWGLASIRADQAYAQLELAHGRGTEPGRGQTVGLLDTGIDSAHPVFAGKAISEHFFGSAQDETGEEFSPRNCGCERHRGTAGRLVRPRGRSSCAWGRLGRRYCDVRCCGWRPGRSL